MATHTVQVTIDDTTFQTARNRASLEGKALDQVVAEFLLQYAEGASAGAPTTYTVQRGDTLGRIAAKVYGDATKYPLIQRANNISNPSRIWIGQVLVVPPLGNATPSPVSSMPAAPPPATAPVPTAPPPPVAIPIFMR